MNHKITFSFCVLISTIAGLPAQDYPTRKDGGGSGYRSTARQVAGVREMREAFLTHTEDYKTASVAIRYGVTPYSEEIGRSLGTQKRRYPFGGDTWARLETNVPLSIGGQGTQPGIHALALEHTEDGWSLVLFPDREVRYRNLGPWQIPASDELGARFPLTHAWSEEASDAFTVEFASGDYPGQGELRIRFGTRQWTAPVALDLGKARRAHTGKYR